MCQKLKKNPFSYYLLAELMKFDKDGCTSCGKRSFLQIPMGNKCKVLSASIAYLAIPAERYLGVQPHLISINWDTDTTLYVTNSSHCNNVSKLNYHIATEKKLENTRAAIVSMIA